VMDSPGQYTIVNNRVLTTLDQKVASSHTALLVVDMQNDFCTGGGYFDKEHGNLVPIREMVPRLIHLIDVARKFKIPTLYVQSEYNGPNSWYLSDVWLEQASRVRKGGYTRFPVCEANTWGADFCDGIQPMPGEAVVKKHRYSAFLHTDLDLILRNRGIRTLVMTGVASNRCVKLTAMHGFMLNYYVVFLKDCTATHSEELHRITLQEIDKGFGEVVSSLDVVRCWEDSGVPQ
jgi:ureidoacrylate peracid hydrolase